MSLTPVKGEECVKNSCCLKLLSQLGVPDPNTANLFDILQIIISGQTGQTLPDRVLFVAKSWKGVIDTDRQFTDIQAAVDNAAARPEIWSVFVYSGEYPGFTVADNVNVIGESLFSVIVDFVRYVPLTTGEGVMTEVANLSLIDLTVDTSNKTDTFFSLFILNNVKTYGNALIELRTDVAPQFNTVSGDEILFYNYDLHWTDFSAVNSGTGEFSSAILVENCHMKTFGIFSVIGIAGIGPGPELARKTKNISINSPVVPRSAPRSSLLKHFKSQAVPFNPLHTMFYLHTGGQGWDMSGGMNRLGGSNILLHSINIDSTSTTIADLAISDSVANICNCSMTEHLTLEALIGAQISLPSTSYI